MKHLACNDVSPEGIGACDFVAHAETDDEVIKEMMDHAMEVHPPTKEITKEMHDSWESMARPKITEA